MKNSKKLFAVMLTVIMAFCALCPTLMASAATKSISADKVVSVSSDAYYKLSVPGEGVLTVSVTWNAKADRASASGSFYVLNSKKKEFDSYNYYLSNYVYKDAKTKSANLAVSKGTYYIQARNISKSNGGKIQLKYSFKAISQPSNYCIGKAISLPAGKTVKMYQTQKYSFDRWFTIKLSKNKVVSFAKTGNGSIELFDSDGDHVETAYNSSKSTSDKYVYESKNVLAKGTYYVCMTNYKSNNYKTSIVTLKWS